MSVLKDKVAVVVGGGTGIGAGIARGFAEAGCRVVIAGRRIETLQTFADSIASPHPIAVRSADVADRESVDSLFAWVAETIGPVDIVCNAAGINIATRSMAQMQPEQWDQVLAINATGGYNVMNAVLPAMRARRDGLIINISSIAGKRAIQLGGIAYCASKFAMTAMGTAASNEVRDEGVRITNVYPGEVNTPLLDKRPNPVSQEHRDSILQPEDFGALMVSIASLPPRAHVPEIVLKPTTQEWF
ncbi:putative oxidoreductase [Rosistilla carotiformis]|uniref:Putative oxidoreductase n=1 Tax=Rosistilla carotiformis TaxID=2528017 RepID=A0A518JT02_9BACT|nr:SDR family NAD(P)-dependent oxidoreductase [Rosistilla carotiformis]QDV68674.1 putative oxidoreductase [Rosistilla carotiformis]